MSGQIEDSEVRVADSGDAEATLRPPPSALAADLECALARLERLQGTPDQQVPGPGAARMARGGGRPEKMRRVG
jgi:hypothetical protein